MNLGKFLPSKFRAFANSQAEVSTERHLRLAFEELGPTFVKLGQLLSTRPDLVAENYLEELTKLQDDVSPLSFEIVQRTLEAELGKPLGELYREFEPTPLAAASIGQVHRATLLTGELVVVKVQRPGIRETIQTDIALLAFLAGLLEKYVPESRLVSPTTIVDEFFRTLTFELDFVVEANNTEKFTENMKSLPDVVIPKVYKTHSTTRVLTLERLNGIKVHDLEALKRAGIDPKKLNEIGARAFFRSILIHGLFHGDLHGGNLFALPDQKIGIIDFGIVGRLSSKARGQLANMVLALLKEDFEQLCYEYIELGNQGEAVDFDNFVREVRNTLSPYLGLKMGEMNSGRILVEATKIATKYQIRVPGDWMLVFKALVTVEGMGRTLDPDFDLMAMGQSLVQDLVTDQTSSERIKRELLWVGKDLVGLAQILPRQLRGFIKKFSRDGYVFQFRLEDFSELKAEMQGNSRRTVSALLAGASFIASSLALQSTGGLEIFSYPLFSVIYFGVGAFFLVKVLWS
jgi:ubiquinone biosynthesis protein